MASPRIVEEPDEEAWDAAAALLDRADDLRDEDELEQALALAEQAAEALAEVAGPDHPDHANALDMIGSLLTSLGRVREAEQVFRRALAIYEHWRDEELVVPMLASAEGHLTMVLIQLGKFADALATAQQHLAWMQQLFPEPGAETAGAWNLLGVSFKMQGRYDEAAHAYEQAAAGWRAIDVPLPATLLHNLAGLACARDRFEEAEQHARLAIATREAQDAYPFFVGIDWAGLGDALAGQDRHDEAEAAYRTALELLQATLPDNAEVAYALHNLADTLAALGRADEAAAAYEDSIARKCACFGEQHHEVAASENNYAALLADLGRLDDARALSARAVAKVQSLAEDHPVRVGCLELAESLRAKH